VKRGEGKGTVEFENEMNNIPRRSIAEPRKGPANVKAA
jgi:hypothetical protein